MAKKKTVKSKAKTVKAAATRKPRMADSQAKVEMANKMLGLSTSLVRREVLDKLLNPGKDINYECGYPDSISRTDYKLLYDRMGIAARTVKLLPEECWAIPPLVYETEETDETAFEKEWRELERDKNFYHYLQRIDILSGIGQFGLLLFGLNDGLELSRAVKGINLKTGKAMSRKGNKYELLFLRPFDEAVVTVQKKVTDTSSPRYGYPEIYNIDFESDGVGTDKSGNSTKGTVKVHWTRVLHVADNREVSETNGVPRMKPFYNRLLDIRKVLGGSGEMFWKGGFPGYSFEVNPELTNASLDTDTLKEEMLAYTSGLQRWMALEGVSVKNLAPQVSDPSAHIASQLRAIALSMGIPYRIFIGTEEAKLASSQDIKTWNKRLMKRQEGYVSPLLIRPFVERLVAYGVLSAPSEEGFSINWPDLNSPDDKEKAEVAIKKTEAMARYVSGGVDALFPEKEFLMMVMGLTEEEAEAIMQATAERLEALEDEEPDEEPDEDVDEEDVDEEE